MESFHCFFVFGWIKLKFGVRGNFRLLISNLNSKRSISSKYEPSDGQAILADISGKGGGGEGAEEGVVTPS